MAQCSLARRLLFAKFSRPLLRGEKGVGELVIGMLDSMPKPAVALFDSSGHVLAESFKCKVFGAHFLQTLPRQQVRFLPFLAPVVYVARIAGHFADLFE